MKEYGPGISITDSEDAEQSPSAPKANTLKRPFICQADATGALMVADLGNHRLLVLHEDEWREVQFRQELKMPYDAVLWNGKLYVSSLIDRSQSCITIYT